MSYELFGLFVTESFIISGSYGGHRRHTMDDGRRTRPGVWHKLPTGELKTFIDLDLFYSKYLKILT